MEDILKFLVGSQAQYNALEVKDDNALYFITDTHRIYRGDKLFASGLIENLEQVGSIEFYGGSATDILG
jgi:hypothetical protein